MKSQYTNSYPKTHPKQAVWHQLLIKYMHICQHQVNVHVFPLLPICCSNLVHGKMIVKIN